MIPVGYMAKRVGKRPDRFEPPPVVDVFSVSNCDCEDFADYLKFWKHNGYWFFDSPEIIATIAQENAIQIKGTSLFYDEGYEMEFDGEIWRPFSPEPSFRTNVIPPAKKSLEGFDVVNFTARTSPECVGLSCTSLATELGRMLTAYLTPSTMPRQMSAMEQSMNLSRVHTESFLCIP
jgi:hypothetical protein